MAPENTSKASQAEFDVIQNRIAFALAKRESLVKSWTASSSRAQEPTKTEEELDAEDALHFRKEPPNLGVGAPIPSHFLVSEAQQNNKSLRAKFFPTKGLKASKARDAEEKAASARRAMKDESSDEEGGRSGLGKAKKRKTVKHTAAIVQDHELPESSTAVSSVGQQVNPTVQSVGKVISKTQVEEVQETNDRVEVEKLAKNNMSKPVLVSSTIHHNSPSPAPSNIGASTNSKPEETNALEASGVKVRAVATGKEEAMLSQPDEDARRRKLKLKKKKAKREKKQRQKALAVTS